MAQRHIFGHQGIELLNRQKLFLYFLQYQKFVLRKNAEALQILYDLFDKQKNKL